jgi:hypothetical protein
MVGLISGVFIPPPFAERLTFCKALVQHAENRTVVGVEMSKNVYLLCKMMFQASTVMSSNAFFYSNKCCFFFTSGSSFAQLKV